MVAGIYRVSDDITLFVQALTDPDNLSGVPIHIADGRNRVKTDSMQLVGLLHDNFGKLLKVLLVHRNPQLLDVLGWQVVLEAALPQ